MSQDFEIFAPLRFYKSGENDLAVAGVISTEALDQQGEVVLQDGLDFSYFMSKGWYNRNHGSRPEDVLGYPTQVIKFKKGQQLPDGTVAEANGTWAEGRLYGEYAPAREIWNLGAAIQKSGSGRALGFSIEGKIGARKGQDRKVIAQAQVHNVAITHCPVNADTRLLTLVKSLQNPTLAEEPAAPVIRQPAALSAGAAVDLVLQHYPQISVDTAARIVSLASRLRAERYL